MVKNPRGNDPENLTELASIAEEDDEDLASKYKAAWNVISPYYPLGNPKIEQEGWLSPEE